MSRTAGLVHLCRFAMIFDCKARGYKSGTTISLRIWISITTVLFCLPFDVNFYTSKSGKLKEVRDLVKTSRLYACNSSKVPSSSFRDSWISWYTLSLLSAILEYQSSFRRTVIYRSGRILTKPWDFQMEWNSLTKAWKTWTTLGDQYTRIIFGNQVSNTGLNLEGVIYGSNSDADCLGGQAAYFDLSSAWKQFS